jgi:hypothetical protein
VGGLTFKEWQDRHLLTQVSIFPCDKGTYPHFSEVNFYDHQISKNVNGVIMDIFSFDYFSDHVLPIVLRGCFGAGPLSSSEADPKTS